MLRSSNLNGRCITLSSLPSQSTAGMVVDRFSASHQASLLLLLYGNMSPPHTTSTLCPKPQRVAVAPDVACQVCVHRPGKVRSKPDVSTTDCHQVVRAMHAGLWTRLPCELFTRAAFPVRC